MEDRLLGFIHYTVIYSWNKNSNKWTRKAERKEAATKELGVSMIKFIHENEKEKDVERVCFDVNVKCDPLFNDPNTLLIPEDWQPYEEEAYKLTDKEFIKRHPDAEIVK